MGQQLNCGEFMIRHTPARHDAGVPGWEVPDAMGVILEVQNLRIYISGDTEYDTRLRALKSAKLDVAILCINGVSGNMDAHEAALLAWQLKVKTLIPMHHHLWDSNPLDATLDPKLMTDTYQRLGGKGRVIIPQLGGEIVLNSIQNKSEGAK
jgi:L-ascorbate metabolism protein UlaG (beta-lactamase superfamily)